MANHEFWRQCSLTDAAHFIGVSAVVTDYWGAFVGDVVGDGGQEVGVGNDLEVAVDLGVEVAGVDDESAG